jgi:type I restriction enzyme S subunit
VQVFPGDLILSNSATPGIPKFLAINACIHDGWLLLRNFRGLDKRFAYHLLLTQRDALVGQGNGSVFTNLKTDILKNHRVVIPALAEQQRIADFLDAVDDRIDLLRQTNATLEAIAQALFKSWFVDFDPVRAKADGREPEGMDAETAALFPSEFEESELGLIPKGWRWQSLAEAFDINPKRSLSKGLIAPYLDMASVRTSGHVVDVPILRGFSSGAKFQNGDTLLARITPCLENGKTAHVDFLDAGQVGWGSTEFIVLRPKGAMPPFAGYLLARQDDFRAFAVQAMSGSSGRQRVELTQLSRFPIANPPDAISAKLGDLVEPLRASIADNERRTTTLAGLRDTLLPRLISGKLRLPEAESIVEESLA